MSGYSLSGYSLSDVGLPDHGPSNDGLDRLVERVQRVDASVADQLSESVARYQRPLTVQVAGRAGTGRSSVIRALLAGRAEPFGFDPVESDPVDSPATPDPTLDGDLVLYVLAASMHPADRAAVRAIPVGHGLVVLNKADAVGASLATVLARENECTDALGVRTLPLVAITAASSAVTPAELAMLRNCADGDPALLERWGTFGVGIAIDVLRRNPQTSARTLTQILAAASGASGLQTAFERQRRQAQALRGARLIDDLERLATRALEGAARDEIEHFLRSDVAAQIGLVGAWASPGIAAVVGEHELADPVDDEQALQLARWWRGFADAGDTRSDPTGAGKRAALRIHHGYVRSWARAVRDD
ncbi:hypothetical protein [Antrihabitans spumae]|uniref:GTPase n=1 Tax=Antrihabitans spumae TaxID=3373370 RepID=A0ABW7K134_9NOCA